MASIEADKQKRTQHNEKCGGKGVGTANRAKNGETSEGETDRGG